MLGSLTARVERGRYPRCRHSAAAEAAAAPASAEGKKVLLPCPGEQAPARRGEGAGAGGWEASVTLTACGSVSRPACQSLAELHLSSAVRDGVPQNSEIKNREQV